MLTNSASRWARTGPVCGLAGIACHLAAAFLRMPASLTYLAAFAFGPLLAIGLVGLYFRLAVDRDGPMRQIALGLGVAGGIMVLAMLTVQQAIFDFASRATSNIADAAPSTVAYINSAVDSIHLGLDIAWDLLVGASALCSRSR